MATRPNVLLIMLDQLRADTLGVAGHPQVQTPNIDWLARRGVRFENAFVQSAICGPSRMCFYTGRYVHAHRSTWNGVPLPTDEKGIGEYFSEAGYRALNIGKTHYVPDGRFVPAGLTSEDIPEIRRLATRPAKEQSVRPVQLGMEVVAGPEWDSGYERFLSDQGYRVEPSDHEKIDQGWYLPLINDYAMTVGSRDTGFLSAWDYASAGRPLRVHSEDSPPAYLTGRALQCLDEVGDAPWMMHLSFIYPHCPIAAPEPFHALYDPADVPVPRRGEGDLDHPVLNGMRHEHRSKPFAQERIWRQLRATYYGMVTCVDEQLGRLFASLEQRGLLENTVIVLTSDHGDYLGDHYLSEKEFFFDQAIRVPLIISHPGQEYRRLRGSTRTEFIQSIDLLPTLLECVGVEWDDRIQGRSFLPILGGNTPPDWQEAVFADWDFQFNAFSSRLGLQPDRCRAWMTRDRQYKYIHFLDLPDMLYDLERDPDESHNIADTPEGRNIATTYRTRLLEWRMSTEDRSRSGWYYRKWGPRGVPLPSDDFADYCFDLTYDDASRTGRT